MDIYLKQNIYKDFVVQRNEALKSVATFTECREVTPWDRVGVHSDLEHNTEMTEWINSCIGDFTYENKTRHFNSCMSNPYNFAHVHYDDYDYIVIIYLNLPSQISKEDGTVLVSSKVDGNNYMNDKVKRDIVPNYGKFVKQESFRDVLLQESIIYNSDYMNPEKWNIDLFIPMGTNKVIMFPSRYLHAESRNFGESLVSSRLVEVAYIKRGKK
jgi:hypothetical protein